MKEKEKFRYVEFMENVGYSFDDWMYKTRLNGEERIDITRIVNELKSKCDELFNELNK